jgi:hypothetical protein
LREKSDLCVQPSDLIVQGNLPQRGLPLCRTFAIRRPTGPEIPISTSAADLKSASSLWQAQSRFQIHKPR